MKPEIKHGQMHRLNCGQPLKYNEEKLIIDPVTIPTLIPEAAFKEFVTEENPAYAIQEISYPIKANGYIYDEPFFISFRDANTKRPFAGSALGHSYGTRGKTDLVLVGVLIKSNGDGTGKAYFKNYILPGDGSLRRDWRAGMIHFSLVSMTRDELRMNEDKEWEWHVVASEGAERNDVVDNGAGAMKQKVNHKRNKTESQSIMTASVRYAKSLINSGRYDAASSWSFTGEDSDKILGDNDWANYKKWFFVEDTAYNEETKGRYKYAFGKNGKLYRSGLRAVASRAGQQDWDELSNTASELLDLIDKKESGVPGDNISYNKGDTMPTKQEIIDSLKANTLTFPEVVQVFGVSDQIVTDVHRNAVKTVNDLKALNCTDPVKELTELRESVKANFSIMRNARLDKEFGFLELTIGNEKKANALRAYAGEKLGNVLDKDYDAALKNFKENDVVAKSITEQLADGTSKINTVVGDNKKPADKPYEGFNSVPVEKVE